MVEGRRRRKQTGLIPQKDPCVTPKMPNDVWTVDFKGWWLTGDRTRCNPLTIRDEFSRYILDIGALEKGTLSAVRPRFEAVFRKYGLPNTFRMDNGTPWVSKGIVGLTKLSACFLSLEAVS
ncbi:transposase [Candidatus Parcubacteria bacterium]|nr:MAG: transposase [Candidatus Parcubacteria bacterium]